MDGEDGAAGLPQPLDPSLLEDHPRAISRRRPVGGPVRSTVSSAVRRPGPLPDGGLDHRRADPGLEPRLRAQGRGGLALHQRRLREVTDKLLRFIEYLDSIRDRSTILHEDLSALAAERIARTSNRLTGLAALLLPPSVIAGLFGMNVGGIPANSDPWGFAYVLLLVVGLSLGIYGLLRWADWL